MNLKTKAKTNLPKLSTPIPLNLHIVTPTKDIPSAPSFVEALEHGLRQKIANFNFFYTQFHVALA